MRHFPQKPQLFDLTPCRQQDVLSWKMIARHHSKVHPTPGKVRRGHDGGSLRVFTCACGKVQAGRFLA
jgi:hypothetical protein